MNLRPVPKDCDEALRRWRAWNDGLAELQLYAHERRGELTREQIWARAQWLDDEGDVVREYLADNCEE
jgi:hypothetical protein